MIHYHIIFTENTNLYRNHIKKGKCYSLNFTFKHEFSFKDYIEDCGSHMYMYPILSSASKTSGDIRHQLDISTEVFLELLSEKKIILYKSFCD